MKMPSLRALAAVAAALLAAACSVLQAPQAPAPAIFVLDTAIAPAAAGPKRDLVLAVATPRAWPGFDTAQMAYARQPRQVEYFAKSAWADAPARMLAPVMVRALAQDGTFSAVVPWPAPVAADLRLDTEIVRLVQDFGTTPSRVELTMRVQLVDLRGKRVVAAQELSELEATGADDAAGGAAAADRALGRMLRRLADFCAERSPTPAGVAPGGGARGGLDRAQRPPEAPG
jgi:cholesterol transport system auxiliary component